MQTFPVPGVPTKVLDVGQSLELIQSVIEHRRAEPRDPTGRRASIVSACLQRAGVDKATADRVQRRRLRDLYASHAMPIKLTLGAAVALDAAQRGEWLGFTDEQALAQAIDVSSRLPGLISDGVMLRVEQSEVATPS
jgi:hypothetical protein